MLEDVQFFLPTPQMKIKMLVAVMVEKAVLGGGVWVCIAYIVSFSDWSLVFP